MVRDALLRLAGRLDASYTEDLGRLHGSVAGRPGRVPVLPVPKSQRTPTSRIAVVVHVFYPELLGQIRAAIEVINPRPDVFISVPDEEVRSQTLVALSGLELDRLFVRIVENRGRDIAPKYVAFADVYTLNYDLLLFLHTKKSLTAEFGDAWRDQLFRSLVGSPEVSNGVVAMFEEDTRLGIVAPGHFEHIENTTGWDGNYREARRLARRAGLKVQRWSAPDFASGSMFWARPQALADLTALGLTIDDFPREDGQVGVTIMHALERMVFVAAAHAGYHSVMVQEMADAEPLNGAERSAIRTIDALQVRTRPSLWIFVGAGLITAARLGGHFLRLLWPLIGDVRRKIRGGPAVRPQSANATPRT